MVKYSIPKALKEFVDGKKREAEKRFLEGKPPLLAPRGVERVFTHFTYLRPFWFSGQYDSKAYESARDSYRTEFGSPGIMIWDELVGYMEGNTKPKWKE